MSGDPEQDYFADGIVEDIITALSRFKSLFVIARNSSFTYKGKAVDIKQVGRELGVRYVLEGSVRKSANRLRITGQLIEATTGVHLWADKIDGELQDVFELQDRITSSVVGIVAPAIEQAEIERAKHKATDRLDSYDLYLRGMALTNRFERKTSLTLELFKKAIEKDREFAAAYAMAAFVFLMK
jgi:TolB-like protein